MTCHYNVNDRVPAKEMATSGIMWTICSAAFVIIFANVVAGLYDATPAEAVWYAQKILVITGVAVILQGHLRPPASGDLRAVRNSPDRKGYHNRLRTGLLTRIAKLFAPRGIGTVLTLIPLTLVPTFANLIADPNQPGSMAAKLIFAFVLLILIFALNHHLKEF